MRTNNQEALETRNGIAQEQQGILVTAFLRKLQKMIFIFILVRLAPERKTFSVVTVAPVALMLLLSLMKHCFVGKGEEVGGLRS